MYLPSLREEVSQGDIFMGLAYRYVFQEEGAAEPGIKAREINGVLLTADCEYDKTAWVYIGEVRPMSEVNPGSQGHLRAYRIRASFPLKSVDETLAESYLDFRRIYRFDKAVIAAHPHRLVSFTDEAQLALQQHLATFFGFERKEKHLASAP